jgi:hypothetical protein
LDHIPDRSFLMRRGFEYTAERAAARFLEILADVEPKSIASTSSPLLSGM